MNTVENTQEAKTQDSPWEKSSISNLVRWKSSKIYFARVKIGGRLIRKSLDTPLMSVARMPAGSQQTSYVIFCFGAVSEAAKPSVEFRGFEITQRSVRKSHSQIFNRFTAGGNILG